MAHYSVRHHVGVQDKWLVELRRLHAEHSHNVWVHKVGVLGPEGVLKPPVVGQRENQRPQSDVAPMRAQVSHHRVTCQEHAHVPPEQQAEDGYNGKRQHILKVVQVPLNGKLSHVCQKNQVRIDDKLQQQALAWKKHHAAHDGNRAPRHSKVQQNKGRHSHEFSHPESRVPLSSQLAVTAGEPAKLRTTPPRHTPEVAPVQNAQSQYQRDPHWENYKGAVVLT